MKRQLLLLLGMLGSASTLGACGGSERPVRVATGRTTAAVTKEPPPKALEPVIPGSLRERWRYPLPATSRGQRGLATGDLDGDGAAEIVVSTASGAVVLNAAGEKTAAVPLPENRPFLAIGRRADGPFLVAFEGWGDAVRAYDRRGQRLWTYQAEPAVDWACIVPSSGPARDEGDGVAVGYNGDGGVRMLNADGSLRWHARGPTNVWSVAAVRLTREGRGGVACVNDGILLYDAGGRKPRKLRKLRTEGSYDHPFSVGAVYGADLDGDGIDEVLGLGTTVASGGYLWAFDVGGTLRWRHAARNGYAKIKGPLTVGRFWPTAAGTRQTAVGINDGTVFFFDHRGRPLPGLELAPALESFGMLPRPDQKTDALVAVLPSGVVCYEWANVPAVEPLVLPQPAAPEPPLIQGVQQGDLPRVKALLAAGADPGTQSNAGTPALRMAAGLGHTGIVETLLNAGAPLAAREDGARTALMEAASRGQTEVVRILLRRGAEINARGKLGTTPLIAAVLSGSASTVQALLQAGARVDLADDQGKTALHWAAAKGQAGVARLLLQHGASVDHRDWLGTTPLMWAAFGGYLETVRLLLRHGADPNARDDEARRRYLSAQFAGDRETMRRLEESGVLRKRQEDGRSVLGWARQSAKEPILRLLREAGARQ